MILSRNDLKRYLSEDAARYNGQIPNLQDFLLHNEKWYIYHFVRHLRYMEYYLNCYGRKHPLFLWHFFRYKRFSFRLHITIYPNTVGPGLRIYHVGDFIHVGTQCSIGSHCTLLPGVVFGNKHEQETGDTITVGDNCYFGLGAKIFGTVNIGDNVTIGANSVVTKNIPSNAVAGGIPARILKTKEYH